jgi:hypothetical protein
MPTNNSPVCVMADRALSNQSEVNTMASKNAPTSSADLIRKHSTARVITPSQKRFATKFDTMTGAPIEFSREMTDADAREALALKQF